MASALGIDMGNVYRTVEAVKASRATRGAQETANQNAMATQAATQTAAANVIANPTDPKAAAALAVLNPDMAKTLTETFTAADEAQRAELDRQNDALARAAASVLQADDPAAAYTTMLSQLPPEARSALPATFDANFLNLQIARATAIDDLYESINSKATAETERANELADQATEQTNAIALENVKSDNNIRETVAKTEAELAAEQAAGGAAVLESADANALNKYAIQLLGGTFDQNGNLQTLDPNLRARAQAIATKAEALMTGPQKLGHNAAVQAAAQALGIQFPGATAAPGPALGVPAPANGVYDPGSDPAGIL